MYPLRFTPVLRHLVWGGRRLESVLGKTLGAGDDFAESWEVVDHGEEQSIVEFGSLAGRGLGQLVASHGEQLFGRHHPQSQFPLLFKFLDCHRNLSVQVHPDDGQAAKLDPPDLGKTEAWVVLHTEPGSKIYAGLKNGVDRAVLSQAVEAGETESCLHSFEPLIGDCIFIPARTIHALGAGLMVAEIQQASNTTFRLFDWNRLGSDGQPRTLHKAQSLDTINFDAGPVGTEPPQATERPEVSRLVQCDKFVLDRWRIDRDGKLGGDDRFHMISVLQGDITLPSDPAQRPLSRGQTVLLPASIGETIFACSSETVLLDMYLPS